MTSPFIKYPRTQSLSETQFCDDDLALPGGDSWVIEEKMDGTQLGLSFNGRAIYKNGVRSPCAETL
ncbi:hypothetical protein GCM10007877_19580 [Marinibactrum halimedae]|uniref:Uncharacterized protein n=1 Tax=Marinibactrum halimedae TaxID=1444977 RepID=A0AA37T3P2_9GAMM|nr:hypothetical protein GCM10007877_19580 [Marinibactrum halimedae]